ncbi:hypothetical protein ELG88_08445 [Rhizobium leguminosarum]|uniref:hypothetical protein n=1 Tax=Rhizobium leguminosarum TaxID=384 RepID=UPI0010E4F8A0|nr:hypothetical protein [Rhizobium leguminosarum]TBF35242.1 hypothetical protein ELG88_08445 [Rhizobium leguminosarum]
MLHKEWGLLPPALSGIATMSVIFLSIYYANQVGIPRIYLSGDYIQCDRSVAALLNAIVYVYKYTGMAVMLISFISIVFCYIYDRGMFLFIVICFVIFGYPISTVWRGSKIVLTESSIETLCERGDYGSVAFHLPFLFLSSYVIIGNIVLLAKRWLRGRSKNG